VLRDTGIVVVFDHITITSSIVNSFNVINCTCERLKSRAESPLENVAETGAKLTHIRMYSAGFAMYEDPVVVQNLEEMVDPTGLRGPPMDIKHDSLNVASD
jgi:hypothetical protein